MKYSEWRAERNATARARLLRKVPSAFPAAVLSHALARPFIPPTLRRAVDSYWAHHPIRADRLARALALHSGAPEGWEWNRTREVPSASLRLPPLPYREEAFAKGPGYCCVCGQPVFRFGWHRDLWADGKPNRGASWHGCCVVAWKLWRQPSAYVRHLRALQKRRCTLTRARLLRSAEVDHRVPLFRVWRDPDRTWPGVLAFWGVSNLQVINRAAHAEKSGKESAERTARFRSDSPMAEASF